MSDDIDSLSAGPELDRLVAERVMGLAGFHIREGSRGPVLFFTHSAGHVEPVSEYSTNIRDAWEVVEKMAADGWDPGLSYDDGPGGWWVYIKLRDPYFSKTAPLAICRAALKAVGARR